MRHGITFATPGSGEEVERRTPGVPRAGRGLSGGWLPAVLTVFGTCFFVWLISPGFRADIGGLIALTGEIDAAAVKDWILSFGAFAPVVYLLIVVGQVLVSPIPAGPVTLAGALVFGVWPGLALSMAGSVIGSVIVFVAVRQWGETLLLKFVDRKTYEKYAGKLDRHGWWFFLIMLVPLMPDDAVCALAGLSRISFRRYVLFVIVGRLPGATLTAMLASEAVTGSTATWVSAGIFIVVLLVVGFAYRERLETWMLGGAKR